MSIGGTSWNPRPAGSTGSPPRRRTSRCTWPRWIAATRARTALREPEALTELAHRFRAGCAQRTDLDLTVSARDTLGPGRGVALSGPGGRDASRYHRVRPNRPGRRARRPRWPWCRSASTVPSSHRQAERLTSLVTRVRLAVWTASRPASTSVRTATATTRPGEARGCEATGPVTPAASRGLGPSPGSPDRTDRAARPGESLRPGARPRW